MNSSNDISKLTPRQIHYEKEHLYEEILILKQQLNESKQENSVLKTKCLSSQEEMQRVVKQTSKGKNRMLFPYDTFYNDDEDKVQNTQVSIIYDLKKQNKDLRIKIEKYDKDIETLNKCQKVQKYREIESELEAYKQETVRLKNMLKQSINIEQKFCGQQRDRIENSEALQMAFDILKKDNIEMAAIIEDFESQIINLKLKITELENRNQKLHNQVGLQVKKVSVLEKENADLKIRDPHQLLKKHANPQIVDELKGDIEKKTTDISQLQQQIIQKDKKITELDRKLKDIVTESQEQIQKMDKDIKVLKDRLHEKTEEILSFHTNSNQINTMKMSRQKQKSIIIENQEDLIVISKQNSEEQKDSEEETKSPPIEMKVSTVQKKDVLSLDKKGFLSRIQIKYKKNEIKIFFNQQYLFDPNVLITEGESDESHITLESVRNALQNYPFQLSLEDSLRLARYLVEDTEETMVRVKLSITCPVPRVRSIIRNLLNNYELFTDERNLINEIHPFILKYKNTILDFIIRQQGNKGYNSKHCAQEDFIDSLMYVDVQLTSKQIDFILQKNYEHTGALSEFDFEYVIEMLLGQNHI